MKSVVICGSRRFKPEIRKFGLSLRKLGAVVLEPFLHEGKEEWNKMSEQYRKYVLLGLTHDHFYKIRQADVVFIYNKDGYAGVSTTLELGYAVALGKTVYAFSDNDLELSRKVLIREKVTTPRELVKRLK